MGWWGGVKERRSQTNVKVPGSDKLGDVLGEYAKMVFKVVNWMLTWMWALLSPALLTIPGIIIISILTGLLAYDFIIKEFIKGIWVLGESMAHGPFILKTVAYFLKSTALSFKAMLYGMGYLVRSTINVVMAGVGFIETSVVGLTSDLTYNIMQGSVAILSDKTQLLDKSGTLEDRVNDKDTNTDDTTKKKEVVVKYTDDYNVDIERSDTLKNYDIKAEMLQYSLRFGQYWDRALAVGMVRREFLENYYNLMNGDSSSAISKAMITSMNDSKEKAGKIKDMYYYTYKTQIDVIKAKEEELENVKYVSSEELEEEKKKLDKQINELLEVDSDIENYNNEINKIEKEIEEINNNYDGSKVQLEGFTDERYKNIIYTVGREEKDNNEKNKYNRCVDDYNECVIKYGEENSIELEKLERLTPNEVESLIELRLQLKNYINNLQIRIRNEEYSEDTFERVEASFYGNNVLNAMSDDDQEDEDSDKVEESDDEDIKVKVDYYSLKKEELKNAEVINEKLDELYSRINNLKSKKEEYKSRIRETESLLKKRMELEDNVRTIDNKINNIDYLNETVKTLYGELQREKEKLYELYMGSNLYYDLVDDGENSNENKINYIMDMYYNDDEAYEDFKDNIKERINVEVSTIKDTFGSFVGTENGFEEMSVNDALNSMIQNRYGGYGYPKMYYTTKHDGDDVLGAKVLTYEHTMVTAPEDLKLLKTSMEPNPEDTENMIACISFISTDYLREYRIMGLEDISKFFNAKVKSDYTSNMLESGDSFQEIRIGLDGTIMTKDYELYNITIPEGTAIGSFGSKIVTLEERKAAASRENARNSKKDDVTTDTSEETGYTSARDIAIINDPNTYAQVFVELNESSRNSLLDIEPDFIIPISEKGSYRYASTLKEVGDGSVAKLYGGVLKAEENGIVESIGFNDKGEETITVDGKTYSRGSDNIISFGDRQREMLYMLDPYWSSKQYTFDMSDEPDVSEGQIMGKRHRKMDGETKDEYVKAPSGYRIVAKMGEESSTIKYYMYDINTGKVVEYEKNDKEEQTPQEMYVLDDDFEEHTKKVLSYKIKNGDIIGYRIDTSINESEESSFRTIIDGDITKTAEKKFVNKTSLSRKEIEVKCDIEIKDNDTYGADHEYCDILEVGRDKNGLLRVKLRNNRTNEVYEYIGLSGLGQKIVDKLQLVYNKQSEEYDYQYEEWYKTKYTVPDDNKYNNLKKVLKGEGIAFVGRTIKRDANNNLYFDEDNYGLDVVAPENCILTRAGWNINTGWVIQLTSLDYERRYEFSELSDFSNWIKGVIGSKIGPDWQTKKYDDITIDEYRVIKKGEMIGRMGASKGPEIGDIPLVAPETLRVVQMGYKLDDKDNHKKYCIKLESLDGTRQYEIIDMDIYSQNVHTGLNGDKNITNRTLSLGDREYKNIPYDECFLAKDLSKLKSSSAYYLDEITFKGKVQEEDGKSYSVPDTSMYQVRLGEIYVYEGETIGYAKVKINTDEIQILAGVGSKELQTNILVKNNSNAVKLIDKNNRPKVDITKTMVYGGYSYDIKYTYYDNAMLKKRIAREFDLFDAVHVGVQILKFGKLPIGTEEIEDKFITIDKVEQGKRNNQNGDSIDIFKISYTESEHRATKAECYDSKGKVVAVNEFNYEKGNRIIQKVSYYVDYDTGRVESSSNTVDIARNTDKDTKVTTVKDVPIYIPKDIGKVTKIRLYDSMGMYQDYNMNKIVSVSQDAEELRLELMFAYDIEVREVKCYNDTNDIIGSMYSRSSKEESDSNVYTVDLYSQDRVDQVKIYTSTGEVFYWKPEINSVNKVSDNNIEITWVRGMKDLKEIIYLNDNNEEIGKYSAKDVVYNEIIREAYIIEEGSITSRLDGRAYDVKKIKVCCTDGSYTMYECMSIDCVTVEDIGNINIEFSISSEDKLQEVEILSKDNEVLYKKEVSGDKSVNIVIDKTKVSNVEKVILRSKNGDNTEYVMNNRLYWGKVVDQYTVRVGCSVVEKAEDLHIDLLDKGMKVIGTLAVKDSLINTAEIKIANNKNTTEDVHAITLNKGSTVEDVCTVFGISKVTRNGEEYNVEIIQRKGIGLKRIEFYDKYGNITHGEDVAKDDRNNYGYYELSSEGKVVYVGNKGTHKIKFRPDDVGIVIYDRDDNSREILIKPIITACRVTNKGRLQVEFYEGYGGVKNMKVYGTGTKTCESKLDTLKLENGNWVYRANVLHGDIKEINVNVDNNEGYPVNIIKLTSTDKKDKSFDADKLGKVVVTNNLDISDEYEFFGIKSVTVVGNRVNVNGTNITSVKYIDINGREMLANNESNGYKLPLGEATKIIAQQIQKTYEGTYTREKVIYGPDITQACKVNVESLDKVSVDVKVTGGTNIARTSNNYKANIKYFDSNNNEITSLAKDITLGSDEVEIKTGYSKEVKNVYKVVVCNDNGLVAERVVEDKTIDNAQLEIIDVSIEEYPEKTMLVLTVKVSDVLEIVSNESKIINSDLSEESREVIIEDGSNEQEKRVLIDFANSSNFSKIQITAKYKEDLNLSKMCQCELFKVKSIERKGNDLEITIQDLDIVGINSVECIMYGSGEVDLRPTDWSNIESETIAIKDIAERVDKIKITLGNGHIIEYSTPTVIDAKKVDGDDGKVLLKIDVALTDAYGIKDEIEKIELFYDGNLLSADSNIGEVENITIKLSNNVKEANKARIITKRGFVVDTLIEDETSNVDKMRIRSIEREDERYKINIINPNGTDDSYRVFVKYIDETEEEVEFYDGQYISGEKITSVRVVDSNDNSSDWYDLIEEVKILKIDGGVKVVFERNLCDISYIIWIDMMGTKFLEDIGNVTEYTIYGEEITEVAIQMSNGEQFLIQCE